MTRCRAGKGGGGAHFRVITQSGARSLGPRDPGQPIAIQDRKAHKLTRHLRHPVQDRLGNVDDARGAQKAEPHRHQLGGQSIGAMVERLAQIAVMDQFVEQPVRGAARQVQPLGHHTQRQPLGLGRQQFEDGQASLKHSGQRRLRHGTPLDFAPLRGPPPSTAHLALKSIPKWNSSI
jgi:hypothetical protein